MNPRIAKDAPLGQEKEVRLGIGPEALGGFDLRRPLYRRKILSGFLALGACLAASLTLLTGLMEPALFPRVPAFVWGISAIALVFGCWVARPRPANLAREEERAALRVLDRLASGLALAPWLSEVGYCNNEVKERALKMNHRDVDLDRTRALGQWTYARGGFSCN